MPVVALQRILLTCSPPLGDVTGKLPATHVTLFVWRLMQQAQKEEKEDPISWMYESYLDGLWEERRALIMRLRQIEKVLVQSGRLAEESLPRRQR